MSHSIDRKIFNSTEEIEFDYIFRRSIWNKTFLYIDCRIFYIYLSIFLLSTSYNFQYCPAFPLNSIIVFRM